MRLLAFLGYIIMGVAVVVLGNLVWATILGTWAQRNGFVPPDQS